MAKRACPRCGYIPPMDDGFWHRGFGALSRTDNKRYICRDCGVEEALEDFQGKLTPQDEWPLSYFLIADE